MKNPDGTVVVKTPGRLGQTPRGGNGLGRVDSNAYKGTPTGAGGGMAVAYRGTHAPGWRIVSKTER